MNDNVFSLGALLWQLFNLLVLLAVFAFLGWRVYKVVKRRIRAARKVSVPVSLAETIRVHRQRCKMTQEFVAEALGVSRQAVSKWESGAALPGTSNLLALARLFRVDPSELLQVGKEQAK